MRRLSLLNDDVFAQNRDLRCILIPKSKSLEPIRDFLSKLLGLFHSEENVLIV